MLHLKYIIEIIIVAFGLSFISCFLTSPILIKCTEIFKLYDKPDERKKHIGLIPTLGGISIFMGFVISFIIYAPIQNNPIWYITLGATTILFVVGMVDDLLSINAIGRFIVQIGIATAVFYVGVRIDNLHGFLGITTLPIYLQYLLTVLTITGLINAFNLIDGIDGLAAGLGIIQALVFGIFLALRGNFTDSITGFILAGSLFAFLWYNYAPARIFMGDTGSTIIGFLISILGIKSINTVNDNDVFAWMNGSSVITMVFATVALPVIDCVRVFIGRILRSKSPFSADRTHIHHILLNNNFTHKSASFLLYYVNILMVVASILLKDVNSILVLFSTGSLYFLLVAYLQLNIKKIGIELEEI